MEIYILNDKLERVKRIGLYSSIVWTQSYFGIGSFEIACSTSLLEYLNFDKTKDVYIENTADPNNIGVVEFIEKVEEENGSESLSVKGNMAKTLLNRRGAMGVYSFTEKTPWYIINNMMQKNVVSPTESERKIDLIVMGIDPFLRTLITYKSEDQMLGNEIQNICEGTGFGYLLKQNRNNKLQLDIYQGVDRTIDQQVNPAIVFSRSMNNISTLEYSKDASTYVNFAYVQGDEGINTTMQIENMTGLYRREYSMDLTSVSKWIGEVEIEDRYYLNMIRRKAEEKLKKMVFSEVIEVTTDTRRQNFVFREDYYLGDIVTCIDQKLGIVSNQRITEVMETWDENGYNIHPTLGDSVPTTFDTIKLIEKGDLR